MDNKLELLFNVEYNTQKLKVLSYQEQQKERWDKTLQRMNEIYDNLSFLNSKGIVIEKVCCTEFNQKDASNGFYPYLRLPQFLACMHPIFEDETYLFGFSLGTLQGKYNYESFIKTITKHLR